MGIRSLGDRPAADSWLERYGARSGPLQLILGFTDTGLQDGISAAGATPEARRFTALADAEFLHHGPQPRPRFPLPPLAAGASPVYLTRAVLEDLSLPLALVNAGLQQSPPVPCRDLGGRAARCLSSGSALERPLVEALFRQGWELGDRLEDQPTVTIGECVVGGTTTALALLLALGVDADGRVNSSFPVCNHDRKQTLVRQGLSRARVADPADPLDWVAALGDPMQPVAAGLALAASRRGIGVLLGGGTQMLAVHALAQAIARHRQLDWDPGAIAVGTTRWVADDPSGDTPGLARAIGDRCGRVPPLLVADIDFRDSRHPALRAYEQGFVKEGVAAGAAALRSAACGWSATRFRERVEALLDRQQETQS